MLRKPFLTAAFSTLLVIGAAGCGSDDEVTTPEVTVPSTTVNGQQVEDAARNGANRAGEAAESGANTAGSALEKGGQELQKRTDP